MSLHKKPLTITEEAGLIAHGFGEDIGVPSIIADIFRTGVWWALKSKPDQITAIQDMLEKGLPLDANLRGRLEYLLKEMKNAEN